MDSNSPLLLGSGQPVEANPADPRTLEDTAETKAVNLDDSQELKPLDLPAITQPADLVREAEAQRISQMVDTEILSQKNEADAIILKIKNELAELTKETSQRGSTTSIGNTSNGKEDEYLKVCNELFRLKDRLADLASGRFMGSKVKLRRVDGENIKQHLNAIFTRMNTTFDEVNVLLPTHQSLKDIHNYLNLYKEGQIAFNSLSAYQSL